MTQQNDFSQNISSVNDTDDREAHRKYWFVLETRMNHEKKTRDQLTKLGFECFLASQKVERKWKTRKKIIEQLLIPMKVFVRINMQTRLQVLELPSVLRFMHDRTTGMSVVIPDDQMSQFRLMIEASEKPILVADLKAEPGQLVRVKNGPLEGLEGCYITHDGRSKVKIELDILGSVCVDVPFEDIEFV